MMAANNNVEAYFFWLTDRVYSGEQFDSYDKLLSYLFFKLFRWTNPMDENRNIDGLALRDNWADETGLDRYEIDAVFPEGICSVLEMMCALALRCESALMDDPLYGDRTGQWFWNMIFSLGLEPYDDRGYNLNSVDLIVERFLDREYEENGRGGLFTVEHPRKDMREVDIWYQMCWYLGEFL